MNSDEPGGRLPPTRFTDVRAPTLLVNALHDVRFIQDVVHLVASGIPGARLLELPDAGHLPTVECPDVLTAALTRFLDAAEAA